MTYSPGSPGSSGYPPGSYGAPSPSYAPAPVANVGPSRLPFYLNIAVVVLGAAAYITAFGPVYATSANYGPFTVEATSTGGILLTLATVLAALLAAIGLLPNTKHHSTVVAVLAVLGVLAVLEQLINRPQIMSPSGPVPVAVGWALWVVLALTILQAVAAALLLLYDTEVLTPPAPKPRYEAHYGQQFGQQFGQQYGQRGAPGGYYNQPPSAAGPPPAPRPSYPSQYGGGYPQGPSAGGFAAQGSQSIGQQGPPTPPTGYPSFSPPPAVGSGQHHVTNPNLGSGSQGSSPLSPQAADPFSGSPGSSGSSGSSGPLSGPSGSSPA